MPIQSKTRGKVPSPGEVVIEHAYSGQPGIFRIYKMTEEGARPYFEDSPYGPNKGTAGFYNENTGEILRGGTTTQFENTGQTLGTAPSKYNMADVGAFYEEAEWAGMRGKPFKGRQRYTQAQLEGKVPKMGEVKKNEPITPQTLGSLGLQAGTPEEQARLEALAQDVQNIGGTIQDLLDRIKTEGITGVGGEVLTLPEGGGVGENPANIPEEVWNMMSPEEQSFWSPMWTFLNNKLEQGEQIPPTLTPLELNDLWTQASNDPVIKKFYGDQLKIGEQNFANEIADLAASTGQWTREQADIFKQQRIAGAETAAEKGQAYSGFRAQAAGRLKMGQTGIVESTKRQIARQTRQLGGAFEQRFGTAALPGIGTQFVNPMTEQPEQIGYQPYGDIAGSFATEKLASQEQRYQDLIRKALQSKGAFQ